MYLEHGTLGDKTEVDLEASYLRSGSHGTKDAMQVTKGEEKLIVLPSWKAYESP